MLPVEAGIQFFANQGTVFQRFQGVGKGRSGSLALCNEIPMIKNKDEWDSSISYKSVKTNAGKNRKK